MTAGAFVVAAGWGVYERSTRSKVEEDFQRACTSLAKTAKSLAETQKGRDLFQTQLSALQKDQEDLSRRFVESQLRHRSVEDSWLSDKSALLAQVDRLQDSLRRMESLLENEREGLQKEQSRRAQVEALLAAERDAGKEAASQWNRERLAAEELARRQAAEIQRANDSLRALQGDLNAAQTQLQRNQTAVQQLQNDLSRTLNERDAAAAASQQTGQALNLAVNDLHRREMDVVALQNAVGQLQRALGEARHETRQLERNNQDLARQVQQLTAQKQQLTQQIQQLNAQIKALTDQLNALKNPPRPAPPPPTVTPRLEAGKPQ